MYSYRDDAKHRAIEGDYATAAIRLVVSQIRIESPHHVWKWWRRSLGRRADYPDITLRLVEAILQEFHTGGGLFRQTVARMFGKGEASADLPVTEFIEALRRKRKRDFPLPESFIPTAPPPTLSGVAKKYRYPIFPIRQKGRTSGVYMG